MNPVVIIDYGMGNLRSVKKAFERLDIKAIISSSKKDIEEAEKIIIPGVGHFSSGMHNLKALDLVKPLCDKVLKAKTPVLGICLGMQLLTRHSEEGDEDGLGWIDAITVKLELSEKNLKIPHMGWNKLSIKKENPILANIDESTSFYFVHSYQVKCSDQADVLSTTIYGTEFVSGFQKENIIGVQFHPEKSHKAGLKLLKNFVEL
jgi:glutamine amidotransferase